MERKSGGGERNWLVATWDKDGHLTVDFVDCVPGDTVNEDATGVEASDYDQALPAREPILPDRTLDPTGRVTPRYNHHALGRFCDHDMHRWGD
jgi:hypothetical protein